MFPGYQNNGIPILHGNPYGPAITNGQPNCQAGQTGYALGEDLIPGQSADNPTFGVTQIAGDGALGRAGTRQDRPLPAAERRPHLLGLRQQPA